MSNLYEHLTSEAIASLKLSDKERIRKIRGDRWIGYPRAQEVLSRLNDLLEQPKTLRMPNLLIIGDTNIGKTMIGSYFESSHPTVEDPDGDSITVPVLMIQAPPEPNEGRLYDIILEELYAPYRPQESASKKQIQVIKLLKYINLKMLMIDEIHHVLAGPTNKQKNFLNVIKYLGNELQIPIVGIGTSDARRAIQTDPQLANRFEPIVLPKWRYNKEFLQLLLSFECMLPLKKASNLIQPELSRRLFQMSEGIIGELSTLLKRAAVEGVHSGHECINKKCLDAINWTMPSSRKRKVLV